MATAVVELPKRRGALVCPECGATEGANGAPFTRTQSLGIHRRREHGVVGESHRTSARGAAKRGSSKKRATAKRATAKRKTARAGTKRKTAAASTRRKTRATAKRKTARKTTRATAKRKTARKTVTRRRRTTGVDRDALVRTVFPAGVPARAEILDRLTVWLAAGEQLARDA